ncbi:hypothetical protein KC331_g3189 [Hortaea werneckii]|uniref:NAD(P)-binding protein n=1 Tax=Hortaea werneckii TaxID=91943 RepID=A0A3M7D8W6_HORWE|nr:hypothetical protein KC331_g3189 [Hortaea werneckii]KAI7713719.1 hypothetical protein KC353_g7339 [Hortaea werneckii]RMY60670.1 hypothetical protein D0865_01401 [Hortaea werneckii]
MSSSLLQPTRHDLYPFIDPSPSSGQLAGSAKGKSVLITGAGSGIGRTIAEAFALAGAKRVFLVGRREGGLWETRGRIREKVGLVGDVGEGGEDGGRDGCEVLVLSGVDISKGEDVERMFASYFGSESSSERKKFPPPDILVSNAGTSGATETIADSEPDMWWRDMEVNLKGTYLVARGYIRALREYYGSGKAAEGEEGTRGKAEGRIINVSSNASWRYVPGRSSYAASKLAINSLTEYLDGEEGGGVVDSTTSHSKNEAIVRSVALHPGGVDTDLAATLPEDVRKRILIDKPELAAGTCVYLSLPRADFLMGRFVNCTWDMEELEKHRERVESQDLLKSKVVGMFDTLPAP